MNREFFDNAIDYLQKELGKGTQKFSGAQIDKIRDAIIGESPKALEAAFDYLILNHNGLPTPQKLIDAVRIEASKHRDASWQNEKKQFSRPLHAATPYGRECMKIIQQFFPGEDQFGFTLKVDYENILSDAQAMAIKHPGSDWPNIYTEWQEQWTQEGKLEPF